MPRRGNIAKRDVLADPIYNSKMVTRLVNSVMLDGKKGVAQKDRLRGFLHDSGEDWQRSSRDFREGDGEHHAQPRVQDPPCWRR